MGPIQTYPRGFLELLMVKGVSAPANLNETVSGTLDMLQFYGLSQLQYRTASNAALAEGGNVTIDTPANEWWVCYGANIIVVKTATMTALRVSIGLGYSVGAGSVFSGVHSEALGPFGATETGTITSAWDPNGGPRILPPGTQIRGSLQILGTDATANMGIVATVGVIA